ncbi:MAG: hypothetical protein DME69_04545 [Verrucomicrobia bacterium]|nr:MAG: hypothetical protein DME69_04545 [Verrucomicrobiota bacterium]
MSLKGFHIVFIIFSTLLALGIGASCIWVDLVEGAPIYLAGAILSLAAAVRLIYRILIFTGFFVFGLFWLIFLAWYDYPVFH